MYVTKLMGESSAYYDLNAGAQNYYDDGQQPIFSPWNAVPTTPPTRTTTVPPQPKISNPRELSPTIFEAPVDQQLPEEFLETQRNFDHSGKLSDLANDRSSDTKTFEFDRFNEASRDQFDRIDYDSIVHGSQPSEIPKPTTTVQQIIHPQASVRNFEREIVEGKIEGESDLGDIPGDISELYLSRNPNCDRNRLKPCINGFGNGCKAENDPENPGCHICTCPYKSASKGCAGLYGVSDEERIDYVIGRKNCPNGKRAQSVYRWYRKVSKDATKRDECFIIPAPYCGYEMDISFWRMPRTKEECESHCFSPEEQIVTSGFFFERG